MRGIWGRDVWKGGTEASGTCAWGQIGCEHGLHVMVGCTGIPSAVCTLRAAPWAQPGARGICRACSPCLITGQINKPSSWWMGASIDFSCSIAFLCLPDSALLGQGGSPAGGLPKSCPVCWDPGRKGGIWLNRSWSEFSRCC